jgi:hypothetical protein
MERKYERGISLPQSPLTWQMKERFAYDRIIDENPAVADQIRGSVYFTKNGQPYIALDSGKIPLAEEYSKAIKEFMKKGSINGNPYCAYMEQLDDKGIGLALCMKRPQMFIDLDITSRRLVRQVCGEEHAFELMNDVVSHLFAPVKPGTSIIDEGDDWDFIHPPIFVITKREA